LTSGYGHITCFEHEHQPAAVTLDDQGLGIVMSTRAEPASHAFATTSVKAMSGFVAIAPSDRMR
jgi:hypothetical protein